jgi:5-formyltetrahydrofolate cyclo-ligase
LASSAPDFNKIALRAAMRRRRRLMALACPQAADLAAGQLPLERLPAVQVVGAYYPTGTELDPVAVVMRFDALGAARALPVATDRRSPLIFRSSDPPEPLVPDFMGVPSPPPSAQELVPDLILVPVLAFDQTGGRLGQGGGHYDATIHALRTQGQVFVIGLAYAGQEVARVPREPHDQPMDAILTESAYIEV